MAVVIKKTDSVFIIKLSLNVGPKGIQETLEYFKFVDNTSRSKATQENIDELSKISNQADLRI